MVLVVLVVVVVDVVLIDVVAVVVVVVSQWWVVLLGLGLVGLGWLVVRCAGRFGVGGLGLVSDGLCFWVWGWWVGVGRSWFVLAGMAWVGWGRSVVVSALGLVGWGWSVVVCA